MTTRAITVCIVMIALITGTAATAQTKLNIENVYKAYLSNSGPIISNEEVKGYYFFYQTDKVDRKTYEYTLQITDENLNKVQDIRFTDSKNIILQEAAFNGSDLLFCFFDKENKLLEYRSFGLDGKQKITYQRDLDRKTMAYMQNGNILNSKTDNDEAQNNTLFSVPDKGFMSVIPIRDGREYTYEINFYQTDKRNQWTYSSEEDSKFSVANFIGASDSVAFFEIIRKETLLTNKIHVVLVGLNLSNGRKAFEMETKNSGNLFDPVNVGSAIGSQIMLLGSYYHEDDNIFKDNSLGIGIWVINNQGKILKTQYDSWETDFAKYLPVNEKGKVDDLGYIYFHKILQTSDGKIYAIGEGYKKVVSVGGIASQIAFGRSGGSAMKLRITNMVLISFTKDFKVEKATIYEKNDNIMYLPAGAELYGAQAWASFAKWGGYFDYKYTQTDKEHTTFVVGYTDYEKTSDYKGSTFHTISMYNDKITTDKINLKSGASSIQIMPAKTGSVVVVEYYKKAKKIEVRIEKIN